MRITLLIALLITRLITGTLRIPRLFCPGHGRTGLRSDDRSSGSRHDGLNLTCRCGCGRGDHRGGCRLSGHGNGRAGRLDSLIHIIVAVALAVGRLAILSLIRFALATATAATTTTATTATFALAGFARLIAARGFARDCNRRRLSEGRDRAGIENFRLGVNGSGLIRANLLGLGARRGRREYDRALRARLASSQTRQGRGCRFILNAGGEGRLQGLDEVILGQPVTILDLMFTRHLAEILHAELIQCGLFVHVCSRLEQGRRRCAAGPVRPGRTPACTCGSESLAPSDPINAVARATAGLSGSVRVDEAGTPTQGWAPSRRRTQRVVAVRSTPALKGEASRKTKRRSKPQDRQAKQEARCSALDGPPAYRHLHLGAP